MSGGFCEVREVRAAAVRLRDAAWALRVAEIRAKGRGDAETGARMANLGTLLRLAAGNDFAAVVVARVPVAACGEIAAACRDHARRMGMVGMTFVVENLNTIAEAFDDDAS